MKTPEPNINHKQQNVKCYNQTFSNPKDFLTIFPPTFNSHINNSVCCKGMPLCYASDAVKKADENKRQNRLYKEMSGLRKIIFNRRATDEELKHYLNIASTHIRILMAKTQNGGTQVFTSFQKGTQRYNKKMSHKIIDKIQSFEKKGLETFALTLTWDPKKYKGNRLIAMHKFNESLSRLLKDQVRTFRAEYACVLETNGTGYPHAHIAIAYPTGTVKGYSKMRNNLNVRYGKVFKRIWALKPAFQVKFKTIKGKGTAFYLAKYVSKFSAENLFKLAKKVNGFSQEERKAVECYLYTVATATRQFRTSQERKGRVKRAEVETAQTTQTQSKPSNEVEKNWRSQTAYLITLCNNLPNFCRAEMYFMTANDYNSTFSVNPKQFMAECPEKTAVFRKKGRSFGCSGCILSHIYKFLQTFDDDIINFKYWNDDGHFVNQFDGVNIADKDDFNFTIWLSVNTIMSFIRNNKGSLDQFKWLSENGKIYIGEKYEYSSLGYLVNPYHKANYMYMFKDKNKDKSDDWADQQVYWQIDQKRKEKLYKK